MKINRTELDGVLVITPPTISEDFRGSYIETYNEKMYAAAGIDIKFVQDDISISSQNVLRGIHGDDETWKLISCLYGRIYVAVVNCKEEDSEDFGRWNAFVLSDKNNLQVLVPPKHGVAHLIMSKKAIFHYKQSTYYNRQKQFSYRFDDPRFQIWWPVKNPILSERDEGLPR